MFSGPLVTLTAALALTVALPVLGAPTADAAAPASPAPRRAHEPPRHATVVGRGGAVTSVDPYASRIGLQVLRHGGNAVDAAIATAAALGVTEPYSSGLGGGGYFVYYDARSHRVHTIDGRETAPKSMPHNAFIDPSTGEPYRFTPELVTSGVSVGVPGTPATWETALDRWAPRPLRRVLRPAERLARRGFVVDDTFRKQTEENAERFKAFTTTPKLFLPGGEAPATGSVLKNPDLARTYRKLGRRGLQWFYDGPIAREIAANVQSPPKSPDTKLPVPVGFMHRSDLRRYEARMRR